MTESPSGILLYRATRDGFTGKAFHYVFDGYASSAWNSSDTWINDQNAFLFSLN
jgi:hypothetical protein